ncbi:MAG: rhomboid family intramembrane serine protease [Bacteroidetes bacterium QH_8_67_23]|nr:MAG: rhomboid family intramembrane serine protease [Bacteroidetes bacterium QH_8_67_23]
MGNLLAQAPATLTLLVANVLISLYAFANPSAIDRLSFRPQRVLREGEWGRLITGGFVHAGIAHLAFNMITLYFFGPQLEAGVFGPVRFLLLYFGAELAAHALTLAMHRDNPHYAAVGASGAVSGVVVGSVWAMRQSGEGQRGMTGGIAHEAHLGGALGGLLLTILLEPRAIGVFLQQIGL